MMNSDFEVVGYLTVSGSRRSLKISVDGATYYVGIGDVRRALKEPKFAAQVVRVVKKAPELGKEMRASNSCHNNTVQDSGPLFPQGQPQR